MEAILSALRTLHNDESGQDLIEYALIAVLLVLACVVAISPVAGAIKAAFGKIADCLNGVAGAC